MRRVALFEGLSDDAIAHLAVCAAERGFKVREIIVREGEPGSEMFIIGTGTLEVTKGLGHPDESVLASLGTGGFFGEMCLVESVQRSASVRAASDGVLYALTAKDLAGLFKEQPAQFGLLMLNLARDLSRRLRAMNEHFAPRPR